MIRNSFYSFTGKMIYDMVISTTHFDTTQISLFNSLLFLFLFYVEQSKSYWPVSNLRKRIERAQVCVFDFRVSNEIKSPFLFSRRSRMAEEDIVGPV